MPKNLNTDSISPDLLLNGKSALAPLNTAAEYLKYDGFTVLPYYTAAMLPFSIVMYFIIDSLSAKDVTTLAALSALLVAATFWRWLWLALLQRHIQTFIRGNQPPYSIKNKFKDIMLTKILCSFCWSWGSFVIIPFHFGFFLTAICVPALLENDKRLLKANRETLGLINKSFGKLIKVSSALLLLASITTISIFIFQSLIVHTALPSWLGIEIADLSITSSNIVWILTVFYFIFLIWDFFWTIVSVMLFYDMQARASGRDLLIKIERLSNTV